MRETPDGLEEGLLGWGEEGKVYTGTRRGGVLRVEERGWVPGEREELAYHSQYAYEGTGLEEPYYFVEHDGVEYRGRIMKSLQLRVRSAVSDRAYAALTRRNHR